MKTKIKATANRQTITTIKLEINGKEYDISEEDAKAIHAELDKLFGNHIRMRQFKEEAKRQRGWMEKHNPVQPLLPIWMEEPHDESLQRLSPYHCEMHH